MANKISKIYEDNAQDELSDNNITVARMVRKIEEEFQSSRIFMGNSAAKISDELSDEIRARVVRRIARSRDESCDEIENDVKHEVERETQKEEENHRNQRIVSEVEQTFDELKHKIISTIMRMSDRRGPDVAHITDGIMEKSKEEILDRYRTYTKKDQAEIDKSLIEKTLEDNASAFISEKEEKPSEMSDNEKAFFSNCQGQVNTDEEIGLDANNPINSNEKEVEASSRRKELEDMFK